MQLIRTSLHPRQVTGFSQPDQDHTQRDTRHLRTSIQAHPAAHNLLLLWLKQPYKHQGCDSPPGPPFSTFLLSAVDIHPPFGLSRLPTLPWTILLDRPHLQDLSRRLLLAGKPGRWKCPAQVLTYVCLQKPEHLNSTLGLSEVYGFPWAEMVETKEALQGNPKKTAQLVLNASYCYFICQWNGNLSGH